MSAHTFEPYLSGQSVQCTSLWRWESLGLSPAHLTTHNPFLRLSWATQAPPWPFGCLCPAPPNWLNRPLDTRHLCLQGSWVLVVGVFPAAPPACCKMLLEFSPRICPPPTQAYQRHSFFISTLGFSFKALGTSLILRCVERPGQDCPGLS